MFVSLIASLPFLSDAQPNGLPSPGSETGKSNKPFRILTSGKQVTIKSTKNIKSVKPVYVEVKQGSMEPAKIELASGQGLVFRIETDSRIVIKKMGPAREEDKRVLRRTFSSSSSTVPEESRPGKGTAQGKSIGPSQAE